MSPIRTWQYADLPSPSVALREAVGGHPLVAQLLAQRDILDPDKARGFLDPTAYAPASPYELPAWPRRSA